MPAPDKRAQEEGGPPENPFRDVDGERRPIDPCSIVLFGATGDLTHRKLAPALYNLVRDGHLPRKVAIVGFARRPWSHEEFRERLAASIREHAHAGEADPILERLMASTFYHRSSFEDRDGYAELAELLDDLDRRQGTEGNRLHYLATAPEHFADVVRHLGETGLAGGQRVPETDPAAPRSPWVRVVVEKPFGRDLESAVRLNRDLLSVLDESQIYRIDHYLGKETVQNILAFRFSNGIFDPLWNRKYIEHVQITVAENLGVGDRGPYYDRAGAVRDMVQNHMLQLLALVGMEPPVMMEANAVRDEKVKLLRALRPLSPEDVRRFTVRGQYAAGSILGEVVRGYREEDRVPAESRTATYVALRVHVDNWRWAGVPFYLRHGKRLPKRATEVAIQFRRPPLRLFGKSGESGDSAPNTLILNIQPDEGISLCFQSKVPGPDIVIRPVKMDFRYGRSFGAPSPDAYERLLLDALGGDSTLFTRRDEVETSWSFVDRILEEWERDGSGEPELYPAGSWGPEGAERLLEETGARWRRL